jgi:RHS repeat-associated protein
MSLPGGTVKEYTYDPLMRYTGMRSDAPDDSAVMDYSYARDRMDNILSKDTEHGSYVYSYDEIYQLTGADNPGTEDEAYTYDGAGNRMTSADIQGTWTYNRNNELIGYADISFAYDLNGNLVRKVQGSQETSYLYDIENRLVRVEDGAGTFIAQYYYDPFGRRLWKEVSGTRTCFSYSEEGLIGEYTSSGSQVRAYGYRPGSLWTTDPLFMKAGSQYYFYHNDHLGTPQQMTDINGAVVWSARYDSFGKAEVDQASTITNNLRFPGQYYDEETGLHYNWNRYFNPNVGRYMTVDPIGFEGQDSNLYRYCQNNPMLYIDQDGQILGWIVALAGSAYVAYKANEIYENFNQARSNLQNFNEYWNNQFIYPDQAAYWKQQAEMERARVFQKGAAMGLSSLDIINLMNSSSKAEALWKIMQSSVCDKWR